MNPAIRKQRGFLSIEILVTLALLMMLFGVLMEMMFRSARFNRVQWARQTCLNAVQAQLDCLTALGRPLPDEECRRLWPAVQLTVRLTPAEGTWAGLTRAEIQAEQRILRKTIRIQQSRYVLLQETPE